MGLNAYYPFNGNANDESGNNNNALANGATLTSDRFNQSNKAYITETTSIRRDNFHTLGSTGAISVSAWILPDSNFYSFTNSKDVNPAQPGIVEVSGGPFQLFINSDSLIYVDIFDINHLNNPAATVKHLLTTGKWHNVSFVAKVNSTIFVFIDGVKYSTGKNSPASIQDNSQTLCIGGGYAGAWFSRRS